MAKIVAVWMLLERRSAGWLADISWPKWLLSLLCLDPCPPIAAPGCGKRLLLLPEGASELRY